MSEDKQSTSTEDQTGDGELDNSALSKEVRGNAKTVEEGLVQKGKTNEGKEDESNIYGDIRPSAKAESQTNETEEDSES